MKTFYASLIVFALLLVLIGCNGIYVRRATKQIESLLEEAVPTESTEALLPLENNWKSKKKDARAFGIL